jgi:hypothetical protein
MINSKHPWRKFEDMGKLKAARKIATAKKHKEWSDNDELSKVLHRELMRAKHGIPLDLPKMQGWDFKKGRVK